MNRYLPLGLILLSAAVAVVCVQHKRVDTQPSPQALLTAVADAQHEVTRLPASLNRMTDADEIAAGNAIAKRIMASLDRPKEDNAGTEVYLQQVGSRVAANARRKLPYTFHYVPSSDFVNAFAVPGGHVFVGQGLLQIVASEDALAAVLGHEVEHIDLRHCAERAQQDARLRQLGAVGDILQLPVQLFTADYSKGQELEADRDGTILAVQAGYSFTGVLHLFRRFTKLEAKSQRPLSRYGDPITEAGAVSVYTLTDYFASHPPSEQRAEGVKELARERGWRDSECKRVSVRSGVPAAEDAL